MTWHIPYLERFVTAETTPRTLVLPTSDANTPLSLGPARVSLYPLTGGGALNQRGSTERATRGDSAIDYPCIISGASPEERQHNEDDAKSFMGYQGKLYMLMSDDTHRWVDCVMLDTSGSLEPESARHTRATLSWSVISEHWNGSSREGALTADFYLAADADLITTVTQALTAGVPATVALANGGNIEQSSVEITVTAQGGAVTALTITSATTGHSFSWAGSLAAGASLVIDTGALSVLASGFDDYDGFTAPTNKNEWMQLARGANAWTVTATGANAALTAKYYDAWE